MKSPAVRWHRGAGKILRRGFPQHTLVNGSSKYIYLHRDHLGSIALTTDENGVPESHSNYAPFGTQTSSADSSYPQNRGFTDHEHLAVDAEAGLIHMNGRVYDPAIGRFLSPDPIIQDPYNSQNYNRYSYVLNNPLSMVDPSGYAAQETVSFLGFGFNSSGIWDGPFVYSNPAPFDNYYANEAYSVVAGATNVLRWSGMCLPERAKQRHQIFAAFHDKPVEMLTNFGMHEHDASRTVESAYLYFGTNLNFGRGAGISAANQSKYTFSANYSGISFG